MKTIKLLIFDVGGVFRDSTPATSEGFRRGFLSCGLEYGFNPQDVWHLRGIGKYNNSRECIEALFASQKAGTSLGPIIKKADAEEIIDRIVAENLRPEDKETIDRIRAEYKKFFNSAEAEGMIKVFPYAKKALDTFYKKGYKLGIFTNTSIATIKRDLKGLGLERFSSVVSEEDVKNKKPSGEGIVKIMSELKISPEETVYIGDCPVDIQASRDAGCRSVALLCGMGLRIHLEREKPDFIFRDLAEMEKRF
jgi:HAD superfamily hydrolase (TIGR01662 family)